MPPEPTAPVQSVDAGTIESVALGHLHGTHAGAAGPFWPFVLGVLQQILPGLIQALLTQFNITRKSPPAS